MTCKSVVDSGCHDFNSGKNTFATFEAIVNAYIRDHQNSAQREAKFFRIQRTLASAIEKATFAKEPSGKRHGHQRRIPARILTKWNSLIQKRIKDLQRCHSFEELFAIHQQERSKIKGIGKLTVYDTAQRIGAHLSLEPARVYLHAGTKIGATALGLGRGCESIFPDELPKPFQRLRPREIEDCLCIYKEAIKKIARFRN